MVRIINVKVKGNHLTKDSNNAGTRGEANVTTLRITFGEDWASYVKKVLFWDAHGMNPTKYTLIPEWKENSETNVYLFNIPPSALGIAGNMTFRIDGYKDNKRQRSVSATLEVEDALIEGDIEEVTQTDLDNLLAQEENIRTIINNGVNDTFGYKGEALTAAGNAAESAKTASTMVEHADLHAQRSYDFSEAASESARAAAESARAAAEGEKAVSFQLLVLEAYADAAAQSKTDAETAQGKAEEAYDDFIEKRDETYNIIGDRVSQVEGYIEDVRELKKQAENAKTEALAGAVTAAAHLEGAEEAQAKAEEAKVVAQNNAGWAVTACNDAQEALSKAQAIQNNLTNALPAINNAAQSANNAKTYADNAENAVSQSRYIGANGNWYVWNSNLKTFVDSGETAHAGSTVYVGSNPPSNAQVWIEPDGDSTIAMSLKEIYKTISSMKPKAITITLIASAWVVDGDRYSQIVSIPEATAYSKIDLQPSAEQLTIFHEKDIAFVTENVGGTITVYCIGQKPTNDYTIQATITEVIK